MAFKLTRSEETRLDALRIKLIDERESLDTRVRAEIGRIEDAYASINAAIGRYNLILEEARGFVEDTANERETEWEEKSERWQASERGEQACEWVDFWKNVADYELETLEEIEALLPDTDFIDAASVLETLPTDFEQ